MSNRGKFANAVCQLLFDKYEGNLENVFFMNELSDMREHFDDHVRNIYEVVRDEIPLFLYYDFTTVDDAEDIYVAEYEGWELDAILKDLDEKCQRFYGKRLNTYI